MGVEPLAILLTRRPWAGLACLQHRSVAVCQNVMPVPKKHNRFESVQIHILNVEQMQSEYTTWKTIKQV